MQKRPRVSIIIPVFNRERLIIPTIVSIKKQKYQNWECIVVDDISTDDTFEVLQNEVVNDKRFIIVKRDKSLPKGANTCRNIGLKVASGYFIQFFDSDDIMHSEKLNYQVSDLLNNSSDISLCQGISFIEKDNRFKRIGRIPIYESDNYFEDLVCRQTKINIASTFFKSSILKNIYYDTSLIRSQDYDFISKVLVNSPRIYVNSNILYFVREHNNSITGKYKSLDTEHLISTFNSRKNILSIASKNKKLSFKILTHICRIYFFVSLHLLKKLEIKIGLKIALNVFKLLPFLFYIYFFKHQK